MNSSINKPSDGTMNSGMELNQSITKAIEIKKNSHIVIPSAAS